MKNKDVFSHSTALFNFSREIGLSTFSVSSKDRQRGRRRRSRKRRMNKKRIENNGQVTICRNVPSFGSESKKAAYLSVGQHSLQDAVYLHLIIELRGESRLALAWT